MKPLARLLVVGLLVALAACTSAKTPVAPSPTPPSVASVVKVTTGDVQTYWKGEFPLLFDRPFAPVPADRLYAADDPKAAGPLCQGERITSAQWEGNAFYCLHDNFVIYDARRNGLIATLLDQYGPLAVGYVFAHEWGHAVQDRAGVSGPSIYAELQADCYAGSWVERVAVGDAAGLKLRSGDLDRVLAAMLLVRDAPGTRAGTATSHGSGFDRVNAFQDGYENGARACVSYFDKPPLIFELPFSTAQEQRNGGNIAARLVLPSGVDMLNYYYSAVDRRSYRPVPRRNVIAYESDDPSAPVPTCGDAPVDGSAVKDTVFYCAADHSFIYDLPYLQGVYENVGDFGVMALLAVPWASYVQDLNGVAGAAEGDASTVLASDCATGAFGAAMVNGKLVSRRLGGAVVASPGDLDEAITAFLDSDKLGGAAMDTAFGRIAAFRRGFFGGWAACADEMSPQSASPSPTAT